MPKRAKRNLQEISWKRVRAIFGNAHPPTSVWESQFDYCDDDLRQLAATPYLEIDSSDLWYYFHDLSYVNLQPELFNYLFPICLMDWHQTLMSNEPCSHGDSEFHYGVLNGNVFQKMMTVEQKHSVVEFFRDSFLQRLDNERVLLNNPRTTGAHGWIFRLNSLAAIIDEIQKLWIRWWAFETPGRAIAALQYCSGLMYFEGENPLFDSWTPEFGGGGPFLWEHDSHYSSLVWTNDNLDFLKNTLNLDYVNEQVVRAVDRLRSEPEFKEAQQIMNQLPECQELIAERVKELPVLLSNPDATGWTV